MNSSKLNVAKKDSGVISLILRSPRFQRKNWDSQRIFMKYRHRLAHKTAHDLNTRQIRGPRKRNEEKEGKKWLHVVRRYKSLKNVIREQ